MGSSIEQYVRPLVQYLQLGRGLSPWLVTTMLLFGWFAISKLLKTTESSSLQSKRPPTLPSGIPIFGHLPQFLWNGSSLMSRAAKYLGPAIPTKIKLFSFSTYIVSGPESIASFFKENLYLSATSRSIVVMENAFGCPHEHVDLFRPRVTADGRPDDIEHMIHRSIQGGLSGPRLETLTAQFQARLAESLLGQTDKEHQGKWIEVDDLHGLVQKHVFAAMVHTLFGSYMLSLNPTIASDFWEFNKSVRSLFMGLPPWMTPGALKMRSKMLESIKRWQRHAQENCNFDDISDMDWEPYYGCRHVRERQALLTQRGILDETARAAENFAFMWATNSNSGPAASWFLLEVLQDHQLKEEIEGQLLQGHFASVESSSLTDQEIVCIDPAKLMADPLLQSVYAETLRLRVAVLVVREAVRGDFSFCGWQIKKNEVLTISSRTEAMDQTTWGTGGPDEPYPLHKFWPRRFLVDPADSNSGPLNIQKRAKKSSAAEGSSGPYFSMDGLAGSWIPYGGGRSLCPGRHFAKRKMIITTAVVLSLYDVELTGSSPMVDLNHFGFGTMPPKYKVAARMRRRVPNKS
ncbi:cytochrome P450 [Stachybotrys elegans]|uniref:Cytochrome P450 n=1 Tax=Stachybotrys elegans TaxID=80388 RepID=A0A8K0STL6_9HYPO|nr:cytochrome P450 [Stachybotrys elegans]